MSKVIAQIALTILVSGCLFFNTSQAKEKREWISIGSDAVRLINHQYSHLIELNVIQQFDRNGQEVISSKSYSNNDNVSIVKVKALIQNVNGGVSSNGGGGSSSYILLCLVLLVGGFKRK